MSAQPDDADYFAVREREVRELAERAQDPAVRAVHAELARLYAERARQNRSTSASE